MNLATQVNKEKLAEVAAEAISKLNPNDKSDVRWLNAITKALCEIETNPYLTFQPETNSLLILSETSGQIYSANGTCQCKAFEKGFACYHRALARLIVRYLEIQ